MCDAVCSGNLTLERFLLPRGAVSVEPRTEPVFPVKAAVSVVRGEFEEAGGSVN